MRAAGRPFVHLNAAMSLDGRIALRGGEPVRLSGEEDMRRVHRLRNSCDAVLVGVSTVIRDNPGLLVKAQYVDRVRSPPPTRVVLDTQMRTPPNARLFDGVAPTLIAVGQGRKPPRTFPGVAVEEFPVGADGMVDLDAVLTGLTERGVKRVLVEGGSHVLGSFVTRRLFDAFTVYVAPVVIGEGAPPLLAVDGPSPQPVPVRFEGAERLGEGQVLHLSPR